MEGLKKFRSIIDKFLEIVCAFLFGTMVVICTYQVVTRYFFNSPSTVSEELLTYSFTWMALFASALVFGKRDHMRMGFIADKLTGKADRYKTHDSGTGDRAPGLCVHIRCACIWRDQHHKTRVRTSDGIPGYSYGSSLSGYSDLWCDHPDIQCT